jgi:hypothetical protein
MERQSLMIILARPAVLADALACLFAPLPAAVPA